MKITRAATVLTLLFLLAGCAGGASPEVSEGDALTGLDVSDASEAQTAEISDRTATADEYQLAFNRYRECLRLAGYELRDVELVAGVYEFGLPNEAVESGADDECYGAEFRYVDMLWQSTDAVQNNSDTALLLRDCLTKNGIEPSETLAEMEQQVREEGIDLAQCIK